MRIKEELLNRIEIDPEIMVVKPVIRCTRLTGVPILGLLAAGWTREQITAEYKKIDAHDVAACLMFVHATMDDAIDIPK